MSEARSENPQSAVDAGTLKACADKLHALLRIKTLPIGMRLFEHPKDVDAIEGVRKPTDKHRFTTCQLVTQSRWHGFTLCIEGHNVMPGNCGGVIGLNHPGEDTLSGKQMTGVWFSNQEAAKAHQDTMPRVPLGQYRALVVSPLRAGRLDPPDIVLFYGTPGQMIIFINGLQRDSYRRYDFTITGESACADSWGRALATRETSLSIPCYAERRYGGVQDEELLMALPPEEFIRGVEGVEALSKVGLRYPIPPYGPQSDPAAGMNVSYG